MKSIGYGSLVNDDDTSNQLQDDGGMPVIGSMLSQRQLVFSRFGSTLTGLSMIGQSVFGMVLLDLYASQYINIVPRIIFDSIMLYAAWDGKRRLVDFFNNEKFIQLSSVSVSDLLSDLCSTQHVNLSNKLLTLNASCMFALLSNVGFFAAADLLKQFHSPALDSVATCFESGYLQFPVAACALIANLLSFPGIHVGAYEILSGLIKGSVVEGGEITTEIEAVKQHLIQVCVQDLVLDQAGDDKQELLDNFLKSLIVTNQPDNRLSIADRLYFAAQSVSDADLLGRILSYYDSVLVANNIVTNKQSATASARVMIHCLKILGLAIIAVGFWNFTGIWSAGLDKYHVDTNNFFAHSFLFLMNAAAYFSMLCIGVVTVVPMIDEYAQSRLHNVAPLRLTSRSKRKQFSCRALVTCVIGASPNVYQSVVLEGEAPAMAFFAAIAVVLVEQKAYAELLEKAHLSSTGSQRSTLSIAIMDAFPTIFAKARKAALSQHDDTTPLINANAA